MWLEGSPRIGTKDYAKEAPLLEAMDEGDTVGLRCMAYVEC